jgi:AcrR family transcriptional regulator
VQKSAVKQAVLDPSEGARTDRRPTTQRNREQRIKEILDAARLVLQEDGYTKFATRRVADRVGITHGNLQYYFRTKEDLLRTALSAHVSQIIGDYATIASRPGTTVAQRSTALINRIFENIFETDLPKLILEMWAFAWHEAYVTELLMDMRARFRGILVQLLSEFHPTLSNEACLVRATLICAQMDGMMIFASHSACSGRDHIEFVRLAKRTVKMVVSASPHMLENEALCGQTSTGAHGSHSAQVEGLLADRYLQSQLGSLRVTPPARNALHYRPTIQGKRREIKVNEIISTAATLLAKEGYANFTLARVAKELGILPSALQNYFPTYDDLLHTMMKAIGQVYMDSFGQIEEPSDKPALERLCEIVTPFEESADDAVYRLWSEIWALAQHSEITRDMVKNGYASYRLVVAGLMREIDPSATARECLARATLVTTLIDGTFVLKSRAKHQPVNISRVVDLTLVITTQVANGQAAVSEMV